MNLPNSLTILRIFFIPVLVVILLTREPNVVFFGVPINFAEWGVLILLAAAATDWADGYYARRRSEVTTLGILLDPIADKLLMSAAFISLVEMHLVQGWMAVIIIGREIVVLGLRNIASAEGFTIPASALGKTKMVLQVIAVCAVILAAKHAIIRPLGVLLLWLVVGSAVVSAFQYFQKFWGRVDGSVKATAPSENSRTAQRTLRMSRLSSDDWLALLEIARRAISSAVLERCLPDFPPFSAHSECSRGAFVTLYRGGQTARLRGTSGESRPAGGSGRPRRDQCGAARSAFSSGCAPRKSPLWKLKFPCCRRWNRSRRKRLLPAGTG